MAGNTDLDRELANYIRSMQEEGVLDQQFDRVKRLQDHESPRFVTEVITMFTHNTRNAIAQITTYLTGPDVDLAVVANIAHRLKGSCTSIGGGRMALACGELHQACEQGDRARGLQLFERVKEEYNILKDCLNDILQMERNIAVRRGRY